MEEEKKNMEGLPANKKLHKKITIQQFSSFKERDNDRLKYYASLSPEELLKNLKQMVLASFGIKDETQLKNAPRIINLHPRP